MSSILKAGAYGQIIGVPGKRQVRKDMRFNRSAVGIPSHILREVAVLSTISHPNIVNCQEINLAQEPIQSRQGFRGTSFSGTVSLTQERAWGDLSDWLRRSREQEVKREKEGEKDKGEKDDELTEDFKLKLISIDILMGLQYLHQHQIVHGDLKPDNILVFFQPDLQAKLSDFGLSRYLGEGAISPDLLQSLKYRAPERLSKGGPQSAIDPAVDMWSVGLLLAELFVLPEHINFIDWLVAVLPRRNNAMDKINKIGFMDNNGINSIDINNDIHPGSPAALSKGNNNNGNDDDDDDDDDDDNDNGDDQLDLVLGMNRLHLVSQSPPAMANNVGSFNNDEEEEILMLLKRGLDAFFQFCQTSNVNKDLVQILRHTLTLSTDRWPVSEILSSPFWPRSMIPKQVPLLPEIKLSLTYPAISKLLPAESQLIRLASWFWQRCRDFYEKHETKLSPREVEMKQKACASLALKWKMGDLVARQSFIYDKALAQEEWRLLWLLQCRLLPFVTFKLVLVLPKTMAQLSIESGLSNKAFTSDDGGDNVGSRLKLVLA